LNQNESSSVSLEQFTEGSPHPPCDVTVRAEDGLKFFRDKLTQLGFHVAFELIPVDFVLWIGETPIAAERKSGADFLRSISKGALFEQARAMLNVTPRAFLIIENSSPKQSFAVITKYYSRVSDASVMGIQQWLGETGVHVISSSGPEMTLAWLVTKLREAKEGKRISPIPLRPSAGKSLGPAEQAAYVAAGFPELGAVNLPKMRTVTETLLGFLEWVEGKREVSVPSTRIRNLREKWRSLLLTSWRRKMDEEPAS